MIRKAYCESEEDMLVRLNALRGPLALVVLLSHIWSYTGFAVLVPFNKIVTIAVAFFFFLSGYGLMMSYKKKEGYLKTVLFCKIPYLLWMALLAYIFSSLAEYFLTPHGIDTPAYLPFGLRRFISSTNWYVYELAGFYLLFSFCMKCIKKQYQMIFIGIVTVTAFISLYFSGLVEAYYNSIIGFGAGMYCGRTAYLKIMDRHKRGGCLIGTGLLAGAFISMIFIQDKNSVFFALIRNLAALGAVILALYIIKYVKTEGRLLKFLGRISPELYFYHIPITLLLSQVISSRGFYLAAVLILTFVISVPVNKMNCVVRKKQRVLFEKFNR